jgi:hypothetical protein
MGSGIMSAIIGFVVQKIFLSVSLFNVFVFCRIHHISDVRAQHANTTNSGGSTFANSSMNATGGNNITLGNLVYQHTGKHF